MGRLKLKNFFSFIFELVSFDSARAIVLDISLIFIALVSIPTSWLDASPAKCIFREYLLPLIFGNNCPTSGIFAGCTCPACGMTHALSRLLHLDVMGAGGYNRGVFLVFAVMLFLLTYNALKWIKTQRTRR